MWSTWWSNNTNCPNSPIFRIYERHKLPKPLLMCRMLKQRESNWSAKLLASDCPNTVWHVWARSVQKCLSVRQYSETSPTSAECQLVHRTYRSFCHLLLPAWNVRSLKEKMIYWKSSFCFTDYFWFHIFAF